MGPRLAYDEVGLVCSVRLNEMSVCFENVRLMTTDNNTDKNSVSRKR